MKSRAVAALTGIAGHCGAVCSGRQAMPRARLSCHRFSSNDVRLWLSVVAAVLGNLERQPDTQKSMRSRTTPRIASRMIFQSSFERPTLRS